jgi:hypothetical protein
VLFFSLLNIPKGFIMLLNNNTARETKELIEELLKKYETKEHKNDYGKFITDIVKVYRTITSEQDSSNSTSILSIIKRLEDTNYKVEPIDNIFLQDLLRFFYTEQNITFNKYMIVGSSSKKVPIKLTHIPMTKAYGKLPSELEYIFSKGGLETSLIIAKFLFKVLLDD